MRIGLSRVGGALAALTILLTACGDGTDPLAPTPPPTVAGSWSYEAHDLSGDYRGNQVGCDYELSMTLAGRGATFAGSYSAARLVCDLFGSSQIVDLGGGLIVAGSLTGSAVQFDIDSETIRNTGTLEGDAMSGQVSIQLVVQRDQELDTILVTGPWSAER